MKSTKINICTVHVRLVFKRLKNDTRIKEVKHMKLKMAKYAQLRKCICNPGEVRVIGICN